MDEKADRDMFQMGYAKAMERVTESYAHSGRVALILLEKIGGNRSEGAERTAERAVSRIEELEGEVDLLTEENEELIQLLGETSSMRDACYDLKAEVEALQAELSDALGG